MRTQLSRRLALWVGALALTLSPGLASAQDGQPPVTAPRTNANRNDPARPATGTAPTQTTDQLPAVPSTARDPAPPGTRGVRVDVPPGATPGQPGAAAQPAAPGQPIVPDQAATRTIPGVKYVEGVVTRLKEPGNDLPEERLRLTFDPSLDWDSYVSAGPRGLAHRGRDRSAAPSKSARTNRDGAVAAGDRPADDRPGRKTGERAEEPRTSQERATADASEGDRGIELVVTRRTYIVTYARSPEGQDLFDFDHPSAPEVQRSRTGETTRGVVPSPSPQPASFANIREGSFLAVRYRPVGDVNEVVNVSLIELPTNPTPPAVLPAGTTGGPTPEAGLTRPSGEPIGAPRTRPGDAGARPGAAPTAPRGAPATPGGGTRVPVVPTTPTEPATPR